MQNKEEDKPFPWNECILKLSFLLQFFAFILCGIGFFSPFWYIELNTDIRAGLWGRCDRLLECIWFVERSFQQSLPGWRIAAQAMFTIGYLIQLISLLLTIGNVIFGCCKQKVFAKETCPFLIGSLIAAAMVFEAFSMGIFGIGAYEVYECSINSWVANFEWAFYVGISGLCTCLFASLSYFYVGYAIREEYKGYDPFSISYRA